MAATAHHLLRRWLLALAAGMALAGCAGTGPAGSDGTTTPRGGSNVEVFGVIDVGVSHTTNKSGR